MITGVQDGSVGRIRYHRDMILGRVHRVAVHSFDDCNDDRSTGTQRAVPLRLGPQVQTLLPREGQRRSERRTEGGGRSGSTIFPRIRDTGGGRGHSKNGTIAHPAVVMAHGIGGIKAGGLAPFAARFREEGFAAIAFDYRNFGGSGGQPREVLSVPRQRADYSTVIGWAGQQAYIDAHQIIAWGTSFAGMHIVELAVSDSRLAAAVAQAPLTDGLAAAMMSPLKNGIRLFSLALIDRVGSLFGRQPIYIPGHGRPGDLSIGATPDGPFGEKLMTPKDGTRWHDRVAARSLLSFSWRRPVRRAGSVRIPFLLVVPEADAIAPVPAALEVARRAPGAELFRSGGGHYDVYEGGASFADVLRTEIDFLHRRAKVANRNE
jgi:fermentation-respiration switch protein FrsA (DUF1100 family)